MSSTPTLNSRLRVLVAKTFRAEKLYGSIRNVQGEKLSNPTVLSQMANDVRAKEWQRSHYQLRVALNDLLAQGAGPAIAEDIAALRERFRLKMEESAVAVEQGSQVLAETVKRQEFAHVFKLSVELIRQKAKAQACRVITEELTAALESSGRQIPNGIEAATLVNELEEQGNTGTSEVGTGELMRSNVIPLRRAAGTRERL